MLEEAGLNAYVAFSIARSITAHHGYWDEGCPWPRSLAYKVAQDELTQLLRVILQPQDLPSSAPDDLSAFGMRLAGHIVLSDWIASNEEFFDWPIFQEIDDPWDYANLAFSMAKHEVEQLQFQRAAGSPKPDHVVSSPRPLQQAILDSAIPPGLVIIEAPMGEGKTEAAWILAEQWREHGYHGMYMALPTMATSDSVYARYGKDYLEKLNRGDAAQLVHGMAWLRDEKEPESPPEVGEPGDDRTAAAAWFRPTRRAMLAAHGVGTVDQAMLAGMHVKFGFLRLFGMADRVLVIDEVHAYDAYMSAIICRLLQWCACLKIPVIMLSATLSSKQRLAMLESYGGTGGDTGPEAAYPLISIAEAGKEVRLLEAVASGSRTLGLRTHEGFLGNAAKTANLANDIAKQGGCCCVILNTVKQAQTVYDALGDETPKLLFHARFTAADRERLTNCVVKLFGKDTANRPRRFILVATQVVEQSLDVDFDHMITEIAPMDLLLQRSGRLHRHRIRNSNPVLHVLLPEEGTGQFEGTGYVYAEKPLLRTMAQLRVCGQVDLPSDFRSLIERTYGSSSWESPGTDWETIQKADDQWDRDTEIWQSEGQTFALREPNRRMFQPVKNAPEGDDSDDGNGWRAKTRLGANDRTAVLVPAAEQDILRSGELSKRAVKDVYQRSVKIARYLPVFEPLEGYLPAVEAGGRLKGLLLLPISDEGVWKGIDGRMNKYEIRYDLELGLLAGKVL